MKQEYVGYIKEVNYPDWLSNVVMVKKSNEKWNMCMDFTDLNKACLNDNFLLSIINRLVDVSSKNKVLCLMDAFNGYNQILIYPKDQEKTYHYKRWALLLQGNAFWFKE